MRVKGVGFTERAMRMVFMTGTIARATVWSTICLRLRVQGSGFRVQGLGCRV